MNKVVLISVAICLAVVQSGGQAVGEGSGGQGRTINDDQPSVGMPQSPSMEPNGSSKSITSTSNKNNNNKGWTAHLFHGRKLVCAGAIIHEKFILTTSSCLDKFIDGDLKVMVGANYDQEVEVQGVDTDFRPGGRDIGLISLKKPLEFGNGIEKVKLADDYMFGSVAVVEYDGSWSKWIMKKCANDVEQELICVRDSSMNQCYGYNGSGAMVDDEVPVLVGIAHPKVANSICGSGKFTGIFSVKSWISKKTGGIV